MLFIGLKEREREIDIERERETEREKRHLMLLYFNPNLTNGFHLLDI